MQAGRALLLRCNIMPIESDYSKPRSSAEFQKILLFFFSSYVCSDASFVPLILFYFSPSSIFFTWSPFLSINSAQARYETENNTTIALLGVRSFVS
jgi:hypothetical protein